jgi:PHP domain
MLTKLLPTLGRAIQVSLVLTVLIAILIKLKYTDKPRRDLPHLVTFPFRYNISADPDTVPWDPSFGDYNVLLETHTHTYFSDGSMSPEQVVEWALAYGYTAVVVTDHNTIRGGLRAKKYALDKGYNETILVIPGVEYTCCRVHMNLIGINETIQPSVAWPTDMEIENAIKRTHELGGIALLNHWAWSHVVGMSQLISVTDSRGRVR